jgi:hypothetical protein
MSLVRFPAQFLKGGSTMEPRHEERKDREPRTEPKEAKPRRFRIVKLEERVAPGAHKSSPFGCYPNTVPPGHCK